MAAIPQTPAQVIGHKAEVVARRYLEEKGWLFVAANWLCKAGEIDIIMKDGDTLVFVEVRMRSNTAYGLPTETVTWQKQNKVMRASLFYQKRFGYWDDIRFDVVGITVDNQGKPLIDHIENAFGMCG